MKHNDIKPQNFLVKLKKTQIERKRKRKGFLKIQKNNLMQIQIMLTDFGLSGPESRGGTPLFACPECFAGKERKTKIGNQDIFSLGRVVFYLLSTKVNFLKFLFVPVLSKKGKAKIQNLIQNDPMLWLISKMLRYYDRISLPEIKKDFSLISQFLSEETQKDIGDTISKFVTKEAREYLQNLEHIS